jgi:hypothetical protein
MQPLISHIGDSQRRKKASLIGIIDMLFPFSSSFSASLLNPPLHFSSYTTQPGMLLLLYTLMAMGFLPQCSIKAGLGRKRKGKSGRTAVAGVAQQLRRQ